MSAQNTGPEIPTSAQSMPFATAQQIMIGDEAFSRWTTRNRLKEMYIIQIGKMLGKKNANTKKIRDLQEMIEKLCAPDPITQQVLQKLL